MLLYEKTEEINPSFSFSQACFQVASANITLGPVEFTLGSYIIMIPQAGTVAIGFGTMKKLLFLWDYILLWCMEGNHNSVLLYKKTIP